MPAKLLPPEAIPAMASQITSPAMLRALRQLQQSGFIMNGSGVDEETFSALQQLAELGLVDPGYDGPTNGKPFIWVSNHNGERVVKHFETTPFREENLRFKLVINPRARTALASLPEREQWAVISAAEALRASEPASWPRGKVVALGQEKQVYLLQVSSDLRAFIRILGTDTIELFDIVPEDTLRLFLERYSSGSGIG
ncbi:MAG: hypothetical protein HYS12_29725 [Planctomycetes bacterium]|nr:hypothetical protein [Planctomycetota bacterium]